MGGLARKPRAKQAKEGCPNMNLSKSSHLVKNQCSRELLEQEIQPLFTHLAWAIEQSAMASTDQERIRWYDQAVTISKRIAEMQVLLLSAPSETQLTEMELPWE